MASIKPILNSTQIALEKEAADRFGAAVEDFSRGVIGPALGQPAPLAGNQVPFNRNDGGFYATSYAHALAGGTDFRPKLKFLFKVEFVFTPEARAAFPHVFGNAAANDFTFLVRSVDRPKIDFEYEDDVNMYNFRTKVLKKIRHRELTITFMDDVGNRVIKFFRALMMLHSPITRRQLDREVFGVDRTTPPKPASINSGNGMMFENIRDSRNDNAIRGVVNSKVGGAIETIRIKQIFVDPGAPLGAAVKEVIFDFLNARLVSFDLDDLSHETSDVNIMTMQFDYDWMEIVEVGSLQTVDGPIYNVAVPGVGGAPVDISLPNRSFDNPGGGNAFLDIISSSIGRAGQQVTSEAINRGVASIAGTGRFASLIGSQASNILGGIIGAAGRDLINQSLARPTAVSVIVPGTVNVITQGANSFSTNVIDSAEGGPAGVIGTTRSND